MTSLAAGGSAAQAKSGGAALERIEGLEFQTQQTGQAGEKGKDQKTQFGDVWNQIQSQYGKKPEKPRDIKKTLGKDDFMNLMINQMKNQDPTKPFDAEQMAAQLAQFATVEQLTNVNQAINKMAANNRPLEQMTMTHMIGKQVTVDRNRFIHTENESSPISFYVPEKAKSVKVTVLSEVGEPVFVKEMNETDAGAHTIAWDGKKPNSLPAKTGQYLVRLEAVGVDSRPLNMDSRAKANVVGVAFEGTEPVLLIGDAAHQEKVPLKNVIRIEEASPIRSAPMQMPAEISRAMNVAQPSAPALPQVGGNSLPQREDVSVSDPSLNNEAMQPQLNSEELQAAVNSEMIQPQMNSANVQPQPSTGAIQPLNMSNNGQVNTGNNFFAFTPGQGSHNIEPAQEQSLLQKSLKKGGEGE